MGCWAGGLLLFIRGAADADQFYFFGCHLQDFQPVGTDEDFFVELGEALVVMEYEASQRLVFPALGKRELQGEVFIDFLYLQAGGEDVFPFGCLLGDVAVGVVFVLDET